jgi:hypothetical protein
MKLILPVIALSAATYAGYKNHRLNLQLASYQNIAYAAEMDGDSLVLQSLSTRFAIPTDLTVTPLFANETKGRAVHIPITKSGITDRGRIVTVPRILKIICDPKLDKGSDCSTIRNLEVRLK